MKTKTYAKWNVRVLRELTTQWAVFASEPAGDHVALEEPIGAVAMQHRRFVPFFFLWPLNGTPQANSIPGVDTTDTLSEAVDAIVAAKRAANDAAKALVQG